MTARERLRRALRGEAYEGRAAWSPLIDGYFLSSQPEGVDALEAFRRIGADALIRHVMTWGSSILFRRDRRIDRKLVRNGSYSYSTNGVEVAATAEKTADGTLLRRTYTVDGRVLTDRFAYTATSPYIPFPLEHLIKDVDDLEAYMKILRRDTCHETYQEFSVEDARVGDAGLATDSGRTSPIQEILQHLIGLEAFYMSFLPDHPDAIDALSKLMHERNLEAYHVQARSPAEVVIDYENTSTTLISPALYERYSAPCIDEYADVVHQGGKVFLTHRCGKLKDLLPMIAKGRDDGIADLSPLPTGDVTMWDARERMPGKVLLGGLDATVLAASTSPAARRVAQEILDRCRGEPGVILGSGDAVPQNARMENLREVTRVVDEVEAHERSAKG